MECINCCSEMKLDKQVTDNPYVITDSYVCECGWICEKKVFKVGARETQEICWYDEEENLIEVYGKHC